MGNRWVLTDKRRKKVIHMLRRQYPVSTVAYEMGCSAETLRTRLTEAQIDPKQLKALGIGSLRDKAFSDAMSGAPADTLAYLKHYDKTPDTVESTTTVVTNSSIISEITDELNS